MSTAASCGTETDFGPRIIVVASAAARAGRTTLAVNLATTVAALGSSTLLLDANAASPEAHRHFGLNPLWTMGHVLAGERELADVAVHFSANLRLLPAARPAGHGRPQRAGAGHSGILWHVEHLTTRTDLVVIDAPAGHGPDAAPLLRSAHHVLVVADATDAEGLEATAALLQALPSALRVHRASVVINRAPGRATGLHARAQLEQACGEGSGLAVDFACVLPGEPRADGALSAGRPLVEHQPASDFARRLRAYGERFVHWGHAATRVA